MAKSCDIVIKNINIFRFFIYGTMTGEYVRFKAK